MRKVFGFCLVAALANATVMSAMADNRPTTSAKGTLLVFPAVELKWDDGVLVQDTILSITNDYSDEVRVTFKYVNGDDYLAAEVVGSPPMVIERAHEGWTSNNRTITLTHDESRAISLYNDTNFVSLDPGSAGPGGDGRPDPETAIGTDRYLRGFVLAWAVDEEGCAISHNFLAGKATVVHYGHMAAHEYNAYAFRAVDLADSIGTKLNADCGGPDQDTEKLDMNGSELDSNFNTLLLDFFRSGSTPFASNGISAMIDTDLSLLPMIQDLRQNGYGPIHTKADFDIWDENEDEYSGLARCLWCWDQFLLSNTSAFSNHFVDLDTDKGKARIDGVQSDVCEAAFCCDRDDSSCQEGYAEDNPGLEAPICSEDVALLGVAAKVLAFSGAADGKGYACSTLVGAGTDNDGFVKADTPTGPEQAEEGESTTREQTGAQSTRKAGSIR